MELPYLLQVMNDRLVCRARQDEQCAEVLHRTKFKNGKLQRSRQRLFEELQSGNRMDRSGFLARLNVCHLNLSAEIAAISANRQTALHVKQHKDNCTRNQWPWLGAPFKH